MAVQIRRCDVKKKRSNKKGIIALAIGAVIIIALVLVSMWFFKNVLTPFSEEYENSRLEQVLNEYMVKLNADKWNDDIAYAAGQLENDFQTKEEVEQVVRDYLQRGDITQKMTGVGDTTKFTLSSVKMENGQPVSVQKIGEVNFVADNSFKTALSTPPKNLFLKVWPFSMAEGFKPNSLGTQSFDFSFLKSDEVITAEIPESYKLIVGGKEVGEEYITEKGIKFSGLEKLYDEYGGLETKVKYEVSGFVGEPVAVVQDSQGNEFVYDKMKTDIQFAVPCSDDEAAAIANFAYSGFVEAYLNFWGTKWVDITYPKLMEYVKKNSQLQLDMYDYTLDASTWVHTNNISINSMDLQSALKLGDGLYLMTVSANTTAYADGKNPVTEDSVKTVILIKGGDHGFLAIDRA